MRLIDADTIKLPKGFFEKVDNVPKFYEWLNELPTVEPKKGNWIKMSDADGIYWACSECGEDIPRVVTQYDPRYDAFPRLESIDPTPYCPHCGIKMQR